MVRAPTERQREVLKAVAAFQQKHGFAASIRELGDRLNIKSSNGVAQHLQALITKGFLKRKRLTARTLSLTNAGRREIDHG